MKTIAVSKFQLIMLFLIVANLSNGFFNSLAVGFGFSFPYTSFLPLHNDLFADLIKTALSFPGKEIISTNKWAPIYLDYLNNNPYGGVDALKVGELSNLHGMPLPTLIALIVRNLLAKYQPNHVVALFIIPVLFFYGLLVFKFANKNRLLIIFALFSSYPIVFAISRAHLAALILAFMLIVYIIKVQNEKFIFLSALVLALAVNFRPNAIIFLIIPFFSFGNKYFYKFLLKFSFLSIIIFSAAIICCNVLYPDYTIANFFKAVGVYRSIYLHQDAGLSFGSSLFGGLRLISIVFKINVDVVLIEAATSVLFLVSACYIYLLMKSKKISHFDLTFSVLCMYSLFTGTFADYHLIVFFAVFLLIPKFTNFDFMYSQVRNVQILSVALVLSAKNYIFINDLTSIQVIVNPLIIFSALVYTLVKCKMIYKSREGF